MVKLVDGTKFVDTYLDKTKRRFVFKEHGRIERDAVKRMAIYIDQGHDWISTRHAEEFDSAQAREFPELCPIRSYVSIDAGYGSYISISAGYVTCQKTLDANGKCSQHGAVRFSPYEALNQAREQREAKSKPKPQPPRKRGRKSLAFAFTHANIDRLQRRS